MIDQQHRATALLVAGCFFMENLDGTIVVTAAPAIGRSLGVPATGVGLLATVYLLTLAVLIPLSGWLTRRHGARRIFLIAIVVFTLASLGCALCSTLPQLVAMRVLQGAGGAMMVPVGRLVVLARTDKADLLRVMSYIVWPGLLAPVLAPLVGGLIVTYTSWRWLFLINLPLGVLALVAAARLISGTRTTQTPPLDWLGVVSTCAGLGALVWAAHLVATPGSSAALAAAAAFVAVLLLAVSGWHLLRDPTPLVNLRTLSVPTFRTAQAGGLLFWLAVGAVPFLLTLLLQTRFGWSPVRSGAIVLCIFVGNIAIKPATTPLIRRFGFRSALLAASAGVALCTFALGLMTPATPLLVLVALCVASGAARSTGLTAFTTVAYADIAPEQLTAANTLAATNQQLSAGLAVALATVALRLGIPLGRLLPGAPTTRSAFTIAFALLAAVALAAGAVASRLDSNAGGDVRGFSPGRRQERARPSPAAAPAR